MGDGAALLRAIREQSAEDTPRLLYADYLNDLPSVSIPCPRCKGIGWTLESEYREFSGPSAVQKRCAVCKGRRVVPDESNAKRAEFIRRQIAAANGEKLESLELWRLLHHSETWFADVCKAMGFESRHWGVMHDESVHYEHKNCSGEFYIRRGFVDELECRADDFIRVEEAILAAHPVRVVTLKSWPGETVGWPFDEDGPELCADGTVRYSAWPGIQFRPPSLSAVPATSV